MEFIKKFGRDPNKQKKKIYLDESFFSNIMKIETTGYSLIISYFDKKKIEIYFSYEYRQMKYNMGVDEELSEEDLEKILLTYSQEARKEICGILYDKYYISTDSTNIVSQKTNFFKWLKDDRSGLVYYNPEFYKKVSGFVIGR